MAAEYKGKYSMDDPRRYSDPAYTQYLMARAREVGEANRQREEDEQRQAEKDAVKNQYAQLGGQMAGMAGGMYGANLIKDAFGAGSAGKAVATPTVLSGTPVSSGAGATGAGSGTGVAGTGLSMAGIVPVAGAAAGAALLAKGAKDLYEGGDTKGVEGWGGRGQLAITTGGLSELARLGGLFGHKSTRDYANERTSELLGLNDSEPFQAYVQGMREQYKSAPPDPSKPFAGGKYGSWDEYERAGLDASDLTGVYGNIKAYADQWANLDQAQREAVTQANIDAGNYYSNKGDVLLKDPTAGQAVIDQILGISTPDPMADVLTKPAAMSSLTDPNSQSAIAALL